MYIPLYVLLFIVVFLISFITTVKIKISVPHKLLKVVWNEKIGKIYKNLDYENENDNRYDLYIPTNINRDEDQSLILFIHGGSFTGGSRKSGEPWCKFFASKGYVTATMDYTVHNKKHTSNLNLMNEEIASCVKAIKKACLDKGIKVTKMATTGESAGGCLAMLYAFSKGESSDIPVKFVFQLTGPAHFDPSAWGHNDEASATAFISMMSGKAVGEDDLKNGIADEYWKDISPAYLVDDNSVPVLCAYGPRDTVVPPPIKYTLFENLESHSIPYDYIEYPNSNHVMCHDLDKSREYIDMAISYCNKYF